MSEAIDIDVIVSAEDKILASFAAALQAAFPMRVVTRSLKDFSERRRDELQHGVFTVMADGMPDGDIYFQHMKFLVVGQIELPEAAPGVAIEKAEMRMTREVRQLVQRKTQGPDIRVGAIEQSAQLELPYGWVSIALTAGPYDATEPLTGDEQLGNLADFLSFRADIDISQPHHPGSEHQKWGQDTPDYSASQPDAQSHIDLSRSSS